MLDRILKEKYFCGLDIGTNTIKAGLLAVKDHHDSEIVGIFENPTHGFSNTSVNNLNEFSECIHKAVAGLTQRTGIKLKSVHVGFGGQIIEARGSNTTIPLIDRGSKVIAKRDINNVNEQARLLSIKLEEEILHDIPRGYIVDETNYAIDPVGLYGRKLTVESLMVISNVNKIRNISKAVNQAGFDVADIAFTSLAASSATLTQDELIDGCVLIDIGSSVTSVLVFKDKVLKAFKKILIGGSDFTHSIAKKLNLSFDIAEEIKRSYAVVSNSTEHNDEEILVKKEGQYVPIKRAVICEAIDPIVTQLTQQIASAMQLSGSFDQTSRDLIFIGGGALMPGLIDSIGHDLNDTVHLGKVHCAMQKKLNHASMYASVVGLAQYGYQKSFGYTLSKNGHTSIRKHFLSRMRELYQEYF